MAAKRRLLLEALEDRTTPAAFGTPWPDAGHLTLSFAPDGTQAGSQQSQLFKTLDGLMPRATWQGEVLRAAQSWAAQRNLNIGVVADSGAALGSDGPYQGDSRFGDIRVTGTYLISDVLAIAQPFDPTTGTWTGDISLNLNAHFTAGGQGGPDLYSVMLHEFGHAFGLSGSDNPASALYEQYVGVRTGLDSSDIKALRTLYGTRTPDLQDTNRSNDDFGQATQLQFGSVKGLPLPAVADGDITTSKDVDFFQISSTSNSGTGLTFTLHTTGRSLLVPRLTLFSDSKAQLATVVSAGPLSGDVTYHLTGVKPSTHLYVKIEAGRKDDFGIGSYRLEVDPDSQAAPLPQFDNDDAHTNDTISTATDLTAKMSSSDPRFNYSINASISDATDVDFYRVRAPQFSTSGNGAVGTGVLTAMVWGTTGGLIPQIDVYDSSMNKLQADILVNEDGSYTVQVSGVVGTKDYFVAVRSARSTPPGVVGNYSMGVDFGTSAAQLTDLMSGTLSATAPLQARILQVQESQIFHAVLTVGTLASGDATVRLMIFNSQGTAVLTLDAPAGQTRTATLFLAPGTYLVRVSEGVPAGANPVAIGFRLRGSSQSDPIGPLTLDPTAGPVPAPVPPPPPTDPSAGSYWWPPLPPDPAPLAADPTLAPTWWPDVPSPFLPLLDPLSGLFGY